MIAFNFSPIWKNKSYVGRVGSATIAPHSLQMIIRMSLWEEPIPCSYAMPDSINFSHLHLGQLGLGAISVIMLSFCLIIGEFFVAVNGNWVYFFAFLLLASGSAAFLGLPLPGTLRIASTTEGSYILVLPAFCFGWIPALRSRAVTAFGSIFSIVAISLIVKPFIIFISEKIAYSFNFCHIAKFTVRMISEIQEKINKFCDLAKFNIDINFAIWQKFSMS